MLLGICLTATTLKSAFYPPVGWLLASNALNLALHLRHVYNENLKVWTISTQQPGAGVTGPGCELNVKLHQQQDILQDFTCMRPTHDSSLTSSTGNRGVLRTVLPGRSAYWQILNNAVDQDAAHKCDLNARRSVPAGTCLHV